MGNLSTYNDILSVMYNIIVHYMERRFQTVVQAVTELRPDLIQFFGLGEALNVENIEVKVQDFHERRKGGQIEQDGLWNKEWKYWLHGHGCQLTHIHTGEEFDWDAGDPNTFSTGELYHHLKWRCQNQSEDPNIKIYLKWTKESLEDFCILLKRLSQNQLLIQKNEYEWLLPIDLNDQN